jgi:hypothetical protein
MGKVNAEGENDEDQGGEDQGTEDGFGRKHIANRLRVFTPRIQPKCKNKAQQ